MAWLWAWGLARVATCGLVRAGLGGWDAGVGKEVGLATGVLGWLMGYCVG